MTKITTCCHLVLYNYKDHNFLSLVLHHDKGHGLLSLILYDSGHNNSGATLLTPLGLGTIVTKIAR